VDVPAEIPVTAPDELIVATLVLLLLQVPPAVALLNVVPAAAQKEVVPVIEATVGRLLTVMVAVVLYALQLPLTR
jgi:hypothetical protein